MTHLHFPPMVKEVFVQYTDMDTGEIIYKSRKVKQFFASTGGEDYLKRVIDSLFNGVRSGKDISLTIELRSVKPTELDLFSIDVHS